MAKGVGVHGEGEACMANGVCVVRGGMHGRRDGHFSGWYASYWNALLLLPVNKVVGK